MEDNRRQKNKLEKIRIFLKIYTSNKNAPIDKDIQSNRFVTGDEIRQDGGISPTLLITLMADI